jgi:hypothetical protein
MSFNMMAKDVDIIGMYLVVNSNEQSTLRNLHSKFVNKIMTKKYSNLHT